MHFRLLLKELCWFLSFVLVVFLLEVIVPFLPLLFLLGTFCVAELSVSGSPLFIYFPREMSSSLFSLVDIVCLSLWCVGFQASSTMLASWPQNASLCALLKRPLFLHWFFRYHFLDTTAYIISSFLSSEMYRWAVSLLWGFLLKALKFWYVCLCDLLFFFYSPSWIPSIVVFISWGLMCHAGVLVLSCGFRILSTSWAWMSLSFPGLVIFCNFSEYIFETYNNFFHFNLDVSLTP